MVNALRLHTITGDDRWRRIAERALRAYAPTLGEQPAALHDMLLACCDKWIYKFYGCAPGHANCRDNFLAALFEAGFDGHLVPNPLNLWMNIPVRDNSTIALDTPLSKPGDHVVLRALMDVVVVFSACPMDVTPINGEDKTPKPVHYEIWQG